MAVTTVSQDDAGDPLDTTAREGKLQYELISREAHMPRCVCALPRSLYLESNFRKTEVIGLL